MDGGRADALAEAQEVVNARFDQLLELVERGGLRSLDTAGLIRFIQRFERLRNRVLLVESEVALHAQRQQPAA